MKIKQNHHGKIHKACILGTEIQEMQRIKRTGEIGANAIGMDPVRCQQSEMRDHLISHQEQPLLLEPTSIVQITFADFPFLADG